MFSRFDLDVFMGNQLYKPHYEDNGVEAYKREKGASPYTRSGQPPPALIKKGDSPKHIVQEPMSLELHMADERARAEGLTPSEREWRKKWVFDQHLHPDEPIHVDAVHRQLNPIRVFYRTPLDKLYQHFLKPTFGVYRASAIRVIVPKVLIAFAIVEISYYYWKYEARGWESLRGYEKSYPKEFYVDDQELKAKYPELYKKGLPTEPENKFEPESFSKRSALIDLGPPSRPW